jgi:hypothetical protein
VGSITKSESQSSFKFFDNITEVRFEIVFLLGHRATSLQEAVYTYVGCLHCPSCTFLLYLTILTIRLYLKVTAIIIETSLLASCTIVSNILIRLTSYVVDFDGRLLIGVSSYLILVKERGYEGRVYHLFIDF